MSCDRKYGEGTLSGNLEVESVGGLCALDDNCTRQVRRALEGEAEGGGYGRNGES